MMRAAEIRSLGIPKRRKKYLPHVQYAVRFVDDVTKFIIQLHLGTMIEHVSDLYLIVIE